MLSPESIIYSMLPELVEELAGERSVKKKVTVRFIFAAVQGILTIATLFLAVLLYFNVLSIPTALGIPAGALNFYIVMFTIFGVTFLISALFLLYDWWET
ncbi:MAG: hypothetical protein NWE92_05080 [Candidatus Bathyarchaeota archaeon]|nr:hypothetical protein [Candidatus Bathyarchaeota archaeon]